MASHAGSPRSAIASWKMPIDLFLSKDTGLTSACREGEEDSSNACGRGSRTVNTISGEKSGLLGREGAVSSSESNGGGRAEEWGGTQQKQRGWGLPAEANELSS